MPGGWAVIRAGLESEQPVTGYLSMVNELLADPRLSLHQYLPELPNLAVIAMATV